MNCFFAASWLIKLQGTGPTFHVILSVLPSVIWLDRWHVDMQLIYAIWVFNWCDVFYSGPAREPT